MGEKFGAWSWQQLTLDDDAINAAVEPVEQQAIIGDGIAGVVQFG